MNLANLQTHLASLYAGWDFSKD